MYNPYENNQYEPSAQNKEPVTSQTAGQPEKPQAAQEQAQQQPAPQAAPTVTYHTGPIHTGSAYIPSQNQTPYGAQPVQRPVQPAAQPQRPAYTWNPQAAAPQQVPYYAPVQPAAQPPKKKKKRNPKFAVKLLAAALCCAVVSLGSVGVFALLIQNGVVNVQAAGNAGKTAAFTIYKKAEDTAQSTPTVTGADMTPQEVAKKLTSSVVCVQNYQITQRGGFFFDTFGYEDADDSSLSPTGEGSGIIISKDGYIVTNQHVVANATSLKVVTSEGLTYEAELVGEDTQTDLAVIKIDTEDELTPAEFGSSEDLQVADEVMAIGNPGGIQLNSSVTIGHISALNREIANSDTGYSMKCIQTDTAINPGNSGGALVDMDGHVVGINSSKIVAEGYEGLGFAIPSDTAQPIVSDLIEYGYVKDRPAPGFSGQYIDMLTASFYGMNAGYYVTQVTSSEASEGGLRRGDMITAIDDVQVTSNTTISNYIAGKKPGDMVELTVSRASSGEQWMKIQLALSENTGESN